MKPQDLKIAEFKSISTNVLGTASIEMKLPGMRKAQEFTVYPIQSGENGHIITVQSGTRFGKISTASGIIVMSANHPSGAYSHTYIMDKATGKTQVSKLSDVDLSAIRMYIFATADKNAGKSVVHSDNSGAINIFDL